MPKEAKSNKGSVSLLIDLQGVSLSWRAAGTLTRRCARRPCGNLSRVRREKRKRHSPEKLTVLPGGPTEKGEAHGGNGGREAGGGTGDETLTASPLNVTFRESAYYLGYAF